MYVKMTPAFPFQPQRHRSLISSATLKVNSLEMKEDMKYCQVVQRQSPSTSSACGIIVKSAARSHSVSTAKGLVDGRLQIIFLRFLSFSPGSCPSATFPKYPVLSWELNYSQSLTCSCYKAKRETKYGK